MPTLICKSSLPCPVRGAIDLCQHRFAEYSKQSPIHYQQRAVAHGSADNEPKDGVVVHGCTVYEPKDGVVAQGCAGYEPKDGVIIQPPKGWLS